MRGEVLGFDEVSDHGLIAGDDGLRYSFAREDLRSGGVPSQGAEVDFVAEGDWASQIVVIIETFPTPAPASAQGPGFNALSALFSFQGRMRRRHFWLSVLTIFGLGVLVWFVERMIPALEGYLSTLMLIPWLAISVKRLHDMGLTGWLAAIPTAASLVSSLATLAVVLDAVQNFAPDDPFGSTGLSDVGMSIAFVSSLVSLAFGLWIGIADSQKGENVYGPNPKGE